MFRLIRDPLKLDETSSVPDPSQGTGARKIVYERLGLELSLK